MESQNEDRNKTIADASEKQHQLNVIRELRYLGIDAEVPGRLAHIALEDVLQYLRKANEQPHDDHLF